MMGRGKASGQPGVRIVVPLTASEAGASRAPSAPLDETQTLLPTAFRAAFAAGLMVPPADRA